MKIRPSSAACRGPAGQDDEDDRLRREQQHRRRLHRTSILGAETVDLGLLFDRGRRPVGTGAAGGCADGLIDAASTHRVGRASHDLSRDPTRRDGGGSATGPPRPLPGGDAAAPLGRPAWQLAAGG